MSKKTKQTRKPDPNPSPALFELLGDASHRLMLGGIGLLSRSTRGGTATAGHLLSSYVGFLRRAAGTVDGTLNRFTGGAWDEASHMFELRMTRLLNAMHVPTHSDIQALAARVEELNRNIEAMGGEPAEKVTKAPRAAKKAAPARKKRASRARKKAASGTRSRRTKTAS